MARQPSIRPDEESAFYPDGRASRPVVSGTVARGHLRTDSKMYTGRQTRRSEDAGVAATLAALGADRNLLGVLIALSIEGNDYADEVDAFPFLVTGEVIKHGQNRYMIYCVVCHDPLGTGRGKIVERGYTQPPSYHIDRLRKAPVGHFFTVMTEGYGSMPDYRQQIPPSDRWAIAAYIRALQLSQHFPEEELPAELRQRLEKQRRAAAKGGKAP
jgi:mono/diheme cytochrome c family protein